MGSLHALASPVAALTPAPLLAFIPSRAAYYNDVARIKRLAPTLSQEDLEAQDPHGNNVRGTGAVGLVLRLQYSSGRRRAAGTSIATGSGCRGGTGPAAICPPPGSRLRQHWVRLGTPHAGLNTTSEPAIGLPPGPACGGAAACYRCGKGAARRGTARRPQVAARLDGAGGGARGARPCNGEGVGEGLGRGAANGF